MLNRSFNGDSWPIPKIQGKLDELEGSKVFSTKDLFIMYLEVRLRDNCKEKKTFFFRFGTFQFEVIPFWLNKKPSKFQHIMDEIHSGLSFVRVCLDDVVLSSDTIEEHY